MARDGGGLWLGCFFFLFRQMNDQSALVRGGQVGLHADCAMGIAPEVRLGSGPEHIGSLMSKIMCSLQLSADMQLKVSRIVVRAN